jgi:hypothetical protein
MNRYRTDRIRKKFLKRLREHPRIGWFIRSLITIRSLLRRLERKQPVGSWLVIEPVRRNLDRWLLDRTPDRVLRESYRFLIRNSLIDSLAGTVISGERATRFRYRARHNSS